MASKSPHEKTELGEDYLRRLAAVQPRDLPPELDLFDESTARRGLRLNKAAYSLKDAHQRELFARDEEAWMNQFDLTPEERELFAADEEAWMDQFGLTDEERRVIRDRDWIELWRRGMSIYTMIKLIGVTGTPLVDIGRQMREKGTR